MLLFMIQKSVKKIIEKKKHYITHEEWSIYLFRTLGLQAFNK